MSAKILEGAPRLVLAYLAHFSRFLHKLSLLATADSMAEAEATAKKASNDLTQVEEPIANMSEILERVAILPASVVGAS